MEEFCLVKPDLSMQEEISAFRKELADDSIDQKELFSFLDRLPPTL